MKASVLGSRSHRKSSSHPGHPSSQPWSGWLISKYSFGSIVSSKDPHLGSGQGNKPKPKSLCDKRRKDIVSARARTHTHSHTLSIFSMYNSELFVLEHNCIEHNSRDYKANGDPQCCVEVAPKWRDIYFVLRKWEPYCVWKWHVNKNLKIATCPVPSQENTALQGSLRAGLCLEP